MGREAQMMPVFASIRVQMPLGIKFPEGGVSGGKGFGRGCKEKAYTLYLSCYE